MADNTNIKKFLDQAGVGVLWSKVIEKISADVSAEATIARIAEQANANEIARIDAALKLAVENDVEGMDSIKELATWINEHGTDASAYAQAIAALETKTVLGTNADGEEYATVKAYVEAIEATVKGYANSTASTAETNAKAYADSLASNYDASGAATEALAEAKAYTDAHAIALTAEDIDAAIAEATKNNSDN